MSCDLLWPEDVDQLLAWPHGRAARLARAKRLPHVVLPDGAIRFEQCRVAEMLSRVEPQPPCILRIAEELRTEAGSTK
jgi:hypothetical protein